MSKAAVLQAARFTTQHPSFPSGHLVTQKANYRTLALSSNTTGRSQSRWLQPRRIQQGCISPPAPPPPPAPGLAGVTPLSSFCLFFFFFLFLNYVRGVKALRFSEEGGKKTQTNHPPPLVFAPRDLLES